MGYNVLPSRRRFLALLAPFTHRFPALRPSVSYPVRRFPRTMLLPFFIDVEKCNGSRHEAFSRTSVDFRERKRRGERGGGRKEILSENIISA